MVGKRMDINSYFVLPGATILDAMRVINENTKGIVFVVDSGRLMGTVTDGDIRRYIIKGGDLSGAIDNIANHDTIWLEMKSEETAFKIMKENSISAIPVLDGEKKVIKIYFSDGSCVKARDISVFIFY